MTRSIASCGACIRHTLQGISQSSRILAEPQPLLRNRLFTTATASIDAPRTLEQQPEDADVAGKRAKQKLEKAAETQLKYLSDNWKLAEYVKAALHRGAFEEALLVVQKASQKDRQLVVAWNILIDYQLTQKKHKYALKLYNDMKKRQQLPTVRTFTVIFKGLAKSDHPKVAVADAVKHYNVLMNDSRLEPNSIHLNAVLNVCAKAGDLDSLFLIADSINDSTRAPDATTYATIFHALRHHAIKELKGLSTEEQATYVTELILRAKGIWAEVIRKWRDGKLVIDEELVCIMGRLMLLSPRYEEKKQVLDLLTQTMCIPNLQKTPEMDPYADTTMHNIGLARTSRAVPQTSATYAVPGKNSLSLVLKTLSVTKMTTSGIKYWNLMVRHYGIIPDEENWMHMFHMLSVAKASAHAAGILEIMPDEYLGPKYFKLAMETCIRDNVNKNAIKNSNKILDVMMVKLNSPDLHALRLYLRTSLVNHHALREQARQGQEEQAKKTYGLQITEALARLWEPYKKAYWQAFTNSQPGNDNEERLLYNEKREIIALARQMFSAFNKVINEKMLLEKDLKELRPVGAKINRSIQAFYSNREDVEPKLKHNKPPTKEESDAPEVKSATGKPWERESVEEDMSSGKNDLDAEIFNFRPMGDFIWDTTIKAEAKNELKAEKASMKRGRKEFTPKAPYPWEKRKA